MVLEIRSMTDSLGGREADCKGTRRKLFVGIGNILYLDFGGGNTDIYICQKLLNHILEMGMLYCM